MTSHTGGEFTTRQVDERQLMLLMRDWRQGRATRNIRQAISDGYVTVFSAAMITAMVVNVIVHAQRSVSDCSAAACTSGRSLLPWAGLSGVLTMTFAASRMFGPVLASAAEGFWLMDAPLRRSRLLMRRLVMALVTSFAIGAGVGALVAALTGSPGRSIVIWTLATGAAALGATAFAASEQTFERTWTLRLLQGVVALAGVAVLGMVIATAAGRATFTITDTLGQTIALGVAGVGLVVGAVGMLTARTRLDLIRRARLTSGGSLMSGMQGAMFALDFGLMRDIVVEREAVARGRVRPTRGRSSGLRALVWRDVQRLFRFPRPLATLAVSVVVPYAVQALGLGSLNVAISALVLMAALIPFFNSLRVLARTSGLARCLPFTTSEIRTAASVVPAILTLIWAILAAPAFIGMWFSGTQRTPTEGILVSITSAAAGLIGAIRWVSARSPNYSGPMIATSAGAMPPGMMMNLFRGFDMVALISLPVVFGAPTWLSLAFAVIAFAFLRSGGINQDQLLEMQEENKRKLDETKTRTGASKEKIRIERHK
ncbi:MAG: DUF6297 family protein [Propionibacterium sp.]|nr:DUF6297 family protein [Propionibacterium sp.]